MGFSWLSSQLIFQRWSQKPQAAISPDSILAKLGITTTAALGALAIGVIGLFNIVGTITAGALGKRFRKKNLLALIYGGRTLIAAWFIIMPITPTTVLIFSVVMGSLWLATVPLTSGLVAHLYGLRYMGTLYGVVFFSHQLGSFTGVWLGGTLYDQFGSYMMLFGGLVLARAYYQPSSICRSKRKSPSWQRPRGALLIKGDGFARACRSWPPYPFAPPKCHHRA